MSNESFSNNFTYKKAMWNFFIFVMNSNQTFIFQAYTVVSPLGFEIKSDFDYKTSKIKSHSVRASK